MNQLLFDCTAMMQFLQGSARARFLDHSYDHAMFHYGVRVNCTPRLILTLILYLLHCISRITQEGSDSFPASSGRANMLFICGPERLFYTH